MKYSHGGFENLWKRHKEFHTPCFWIVSDRLYFFIGVMFFCWGGWLGFKRR